MGLDRRHAREGFFGPGSASWKVNRETALLLAGPRALLMQLAHPLVAAGVADHSHFERHPIRRLRRTLELPLGIVFGGCAHARRCARDIRRAHAPVQGTLTTPTAAFPAGTPYDARDPALLLWVHATLVDSALLAYERFVEPLEPGEPARFYAESKGLARLVGVPAAALPPDLPAFRRYVEAMLSGPELEVTSTARRLADLVLHPPIRGVPRAFGDVAAVVTLGLLPPVIRERYGLPWARRHQTGFELARRLVHGMLPVLPARARTMPAARAAERRLAFTTSGD